MNNLILFFNTFLSYLLVLVVIAVLVCVAVFIGIRLRKSKDKKATLVVDETTDTAKTL